MIWLMREGAHPSLLGFLPGFFDEEDPRGAVEQFNEAYQSGFADIPGCRILGSGMLKYPGDPPLRILAETRLRDEMIRLYEYEVLAVIQPDGSFRVTRCD